MTIFVCCFYFISVHVAHRYLHSFPTRRSSDLLPKYPWLSSPFYMLNRGPRYNSRLFGSLMRNSLVPSTSTLPWQIKYRSEEHTSELQSHSDLVCRLLLEKKKNKQNKAIQ